MDTARHINVITDAISLTVETGKDEAKDKHVLLKEELKKHSLFDSKGTLSTIVKTLADITAFIDKNEIKNSPTRQEILLGFFDQNRSTKLDYLKAYNAFQQVVSLPDHDSVIISLIEWIKNVAIFDKQEFVKTLINQPLPYDGLLPLHCCITNSASNAIKFLIEHGADILLPDRAGDTAFHVAASVNNYETFALMLRMVNNKKFKKIHPPREMHRILNSKNSNNGTALLIASQQKNNIETAILMLKSPLFDLNIADGQNNNFLHIATESENSQLVKYLLIDIDNAPGFDDKRKQEVLSAINQAKDSRNLIEANSKDTTTGSKPIAYVFANCDFDMFRYFIANAFKNYFSHLDKKNDQAIVELLAECDKIIASITFINDNIKLCIDLIAQIREVIKSKNHEKLASLIAMPRELTQEAKSVPSVTTIQQLKSQPSGTLETVVDLKINFASNNALSSLVTHNKRKLPFHPVTPKASDLLGDFSLNGLTKKHKGNDGKSFNNSDRQLDADDSKASTFSLKPATVTRPMHLVKRDKLGSSRLFSTSQQPNIDSSKTSVFTFKLAYPSGEKALTTRFTTSKLFSPTALQQSPPSSSPADQKDDCVMTQIKRR